MRTVIRIRDQRMDTGHAVTVRGTKQRLHGEQLGRGEVTMCEPGGEWILLKKRLVWNVQFYYTIGTRCKTITLEF